ncbi:MAG: hypothetical protein PHS60_18310, partial [Zavarzinia sp.]|nr:hypothetical protein [Zavarzinia sp.]
LAAAPEAIALPAVGPGYKIAATAAGKGLLTTITAESPYGPAPIMTSAVCAHSRAAARLWRAIGGDKAPPAAPWVADRLEAGAALFPEALAWTGDLSRLIAWAYIEGAE